jgi:hypothetical protein
MKAAREKGSFRFLAFLLLSVCQPALPSIPDESSADLLPPRSYGRVAAKGGPPGGGIKK